MTFRIQYDGNADRAYVRRLPKNEQKYIKTSIEQKLGNKPMVFGKPLKASLKGFRSLRIKDHRVVFRIKGKTVQVFAIQHRSVIYQAFKKQLKNGGLSL